MAIHVLPNFDDGQNEQNRKCVFTPKAKLQNLSYKILNYDLSCVNENHL